MHVVVSNIDEERQFRDALERMEECGQVYGRFNMTPETLEKPIPPANVVNLFDILPSVFMNSSVNPGDTSALLAERGKFQYQTIKKLAAALEFDYDYALWLDSEAIAVQPFSLKYTFESYIRTPTIWRSRMSKTDMMLEISENSAKTLGRSIDSFGSAYWTLERWVCA